MTYIPTDTRGHYVALVRRKRLYGGLTLGIFALLMISGFNLANDRNAGGFWRGLPNIFDFPAAVWADTAKHLAEVRAICSPTFLPCWKP